jgi:hypothetical protein
MSTESKYGYVTETITSFSLKEYSDDEKILLDIDIISRPLNSQFHKITLDGVIVKPTPLDGAIENFIELGLKSSIIDKELFSRAIIRKIPDNPDDIKGNEIKPEVELTAVYKFKGEFNTTVTGFKVVGLNPKNVFEDFETTIELTR